MKKNIEEYIQELEQTTSAQAILRTYQQIQDQLSIRKKKLSHSTKKSNHLLEVEFRDLKQKYHTLEQELLTLRNDYEHAITQLSNLKNFKRLNQS